MADRKHNKTAVAYSPGHEGSRCGLCKFFLADEAACELVRGEIDKDYWCELFEKKK